MTSSHLNEMYDVICVKVFLRKFLRMEKAYPVPTPLLNTQGPEEMFLSLKHQNPSKTSEIVVILIALQFRHTFYRPQTKRLGARKPTVALRVTVFGHPSGDVPCASEDMACGY